MKCGYNMTSLKFCIIVITVALIIHSKIGCTEHISENEYPKFLNSPLCGLKRMNRREEGSFNGNTEKEPVTKRKGRRFKRQTKSGSDYEKLTRNNQQAGNLKNAYFDTKTDTTSGTTNPGSINDQMWHKKLLLWSVGEYANNIDRQLLRTILARGFKLWDDACGLSIRYEQVYEAADLKIDFVPKTDYGKDFEANVIAYAYYPEDGRIRFKSNVLWMTNNSDPNLFSYALHEFGHALGMEHTDVVGSVMKHFYDKKTITKLPSIDVENIQKLYGPPEPDPPKCDCSENDTANVKWTLPLLLAGFVLAIMAIPVSVVISVYCTKRKYTHKKNLDHADLNINSRIRGAINTSQLHNRRQLPPPPPPLRPNVYDTLADSSTAQPRSPHGYLELPDTNNIIPADLPVSRNGHERETPARQSVSSEYVDVSSPRTLSTSSDYALVLSVENSSFPNL